MVLNSVLNEGVAAMQQSQKKMLQAAEDIVSAGVPRDRSALNPNATGAKPVTDAGAAADDLPAAATIEAASQTERAQSGGRSQNAADQKSIEESLIAQKQQSLVFDALASLVTTSNESVGTLIDDLS